MAEKSCKPENAIQGISDEIRDFNSRKADAANNSAVLIGAESGKDKERIFSP